MKRTFATLLLLLGSSAHAQLWGPGSVSPVPLRVRVGTAPDTQGVQFRYTLPAIQLTAPVTAVWFYAGDVSGSGQVTASLSSSGAVATEVITVTSNGWNRWQLPQPLQLLAVYVELSLAPRAGTGLELLNQIGADTVDARTGNPFPNRAEISWANDAGVVETRSGGTFVFELAATDPWAPASCPTAPLAIGIPYVDSRDDVIDADSTTSQGGVNADPLTAAGHWGIPDFVVPILATDAGSLEWRLTAPQANARDGVAYAPLTGALSIPLGFVAPLDAGEPRRFTLSLTPRGGSIVLRRLLTHAPADPCHPLVRASFGGSAASTDNDVTIDGVLGFNRCLVTERYLDADHDGYGDRATPVLTCDVSSSPGYSLSNADCNDLNTSVHPGAREYCDGIDNDCDGRIDADDGMLEVESCDRQRGVCAGARHAASGCVAGAWRPCSFEYPVSYEPVETRCDALDNDCDGVVDEVTDSDVLCPNQRGVCSGSRSHVCSSGRWGNCTYASYGALFELTETSCDGLDNDCDGFTDADDDDFQVPLCERQTGVCAGATHVAAHCSSSGWQPCDARQYGAAFEVRETRCDGLDNDCDGQVDVGCEEQPSSCGCNGSAMSGLALAALAGLAKHRRRRLA